MFESSEPLATTPRRSARAVSQADARPIRSARRPPRALNDLVVLGLLAALGLLSLALFAAWLLAPA